VIEVPAPAQLPVQLPADGGGLSYLAAASRQGSAQIPITKPFYAFIASISFVSS
jgi:hypothetical protein